MVSNKLGKRRGTTTPPDVCISFPKPPPPPPPPPDPVGTWWIDPDPGVTLSGGFVDFLVHGYEEHTEMGVPVAVTYDCGPNECTGPAFINNNDEQYVRVLNPGEFGSWPFNVTWTYAGGKTHVQTATFEAQAK